jgi:acid phosphatase
MFNTETDFRNSPDKYGSYDLNVGPFRSHRQQLNFLEADLAGVDRSVTPWVIAAGHRPWYSTGGYDNRFFACQNAFESTFYQYGVDLALFGHVHNSQR